MTNLDYGIIGNCRSAALISRSGSMDWLCLPDFDSASVFGKILDKEKGGCFAFITGDDYSFTQHYSPKTNILITKYSNGTDSFEILDFMPRYHYHNGREQVYSPPDVIRYIKLRSGKPRFRIHYDPRLEYGERKTITEVRKEFIKSYTRTGTYDSLYLYTDIEKEKVINGEEVELRKDAFFLISYNQKLLKQDLERSYLKLQRTRVYWLNWSEETHRFSDYNEEIIRSALVLKL
jgi:alpha,alpha-trehalase